MCKGHRTTRHQSALSSLTYRAALCALLFVIGVSTGQSRDLRAETCSLDAGPRATVAAVVDSETLRLADGRFVRLLGTLGPQAPLPIKNSSNWKPEQATRNALETLTSGRSVSLAFDHRKQDRYGRLLAHVFVWHKGQKFWVQGELLSHGHARAAILPGTTACARELLAHEQIGRDGQRGIWRHRQYRILSPNPPRWLLAKRRHQFEIVEGAVKAVAVVKSRIYLNFGDNWRTDFTAALPKKALRGTKTSLDELVALKGKRVRVRGWIERNNGPYIKLAHPDLIEILDPPGTEKPKTDTAQPRMAESDGAQHLDRLPQLQMPRLRRNKKKRPITPKSPSAHQL